MKAGTHRCGFTLVELLVAAGITAFLATLMVTVVVHAAELWSRSTDRLHTAAIARDVLGQIETDLAASLHPDGNGPSFAAIIPDPSTIPGSWAVGPGRSKPVGSLSTRLDAPDIADTRFGAGGIWLRLVTSRSGRNDDLGSISAPVAVAYRISRRKTSPDDIVPGYILCRNEVRPGGATSDGSAIGTLEAGYDLAAGKYVTDAATLPGDPHTIIEPCADGAGWPVIGEGVIDFGLRCYVHDDGTPTGLRLVFPTAIGGATTSINPDVVDVMIRILTTTGIQRLAEFEQRPADSDFVNTGEAWWRLALAHSHVFTRRMAVRRTFR